MTGPRFFNTLTREIEPLITIEPGMVRMYTCGPTVYNHAHIGNFRAYVFEDLLQRHLEFRGLRVRRVMNLTDVDDKTIRGCCAAGVPLAAFTQPFKDAFFSDLDTLRIKRADAFPEATHADHIARMITMIGELEKAGHAYRADDGSVYFRIGSFAGYGRLARLNLDELRPGARVASDEYEKENVGDFALWKAWTPSDGDVGWESPWGRGRPGWHIECSAMATGLLGDEIDIHCGGEDNIFPHHEAEIAQSESVTGKTFVRLWMHCRHLLVDGKKMAKSEGNFFTLRDLLAKGWTGREVRYVLLSVKYREPLNFTFESLEAARAALVRYDEWSRALESLVAAAGEGPREVPEGIDLAAFGEALDDDLNISAALGALFDVIRHSNRLMAAGQLGHPAARSLWQWRAGVESVLAIGASGVDIPPEVAALAERRASARLAKDWALSDQLRNQMTRAGWMVKDTKEGQVLTPLVS
ncbi:MAG: cysteine--tRNA ligase [Terrimicrobiaceae bacterium]